MTSVAREAERLTLNRQNDPQSAKESFCSWWSSLLAIE